jgi:hypothetical protein
MATYSYSPLSFEEIRVLELQPGLFRDPIHVSLSHVVLTVSSQQHSVRLSLVELRKTLPPGWAAWENVEGRIYFQNESTERTCWQHPDSDFGQNLYADTEEVDDPEYRPKYEALSYTWGSAEKTDIVYVQQDAAKGPTQYLEIGQNLASALRHLRHSTTTRTMWIDAVCINQLDIAERNEQVKRMVDIYKLAYRVVVWLGEEADKSNLALSTMEFVGKQLEISKSNTRARSPYAEEPEWFRAACKLPYDDDTWRAWFELAKRPWFERLWIWQEIQLANSRSLVQCGHESILWSLFRRAVVCIASKKDIAHPQYREQFLFLRYFAYDRRRTPFSHMIAYIWRRKCSDPRDKIYGVLGMAPPKFAHKIRPEYSQSVSAVYKDVALAHLQQVQRLETIQYCNPATRLIDGPSWVPDMSGPGPSVVVSYYQYASGFSRAHAVYRCPDILEVVGLQCAKVVKVSEPGPRGPNHGDAMRSIQSWEPEDLLTASYVTGETLLDAYISTLCAGDIKNRWPDNVYPTLQAWRTTFLSKLLKSLGKVHPDSLYDRDVNTALDYARGRTFITTEEGYIGLGPSSVLPGESAAPNIYV